MKKSCFVLFMLFLCFPFPLTAQIKSIADVQGRTTASPFLGLPVTIKGAVTGVYPAGYFMRDSEDAWSGMYVYDQAHKPSLGDTIQLTAIVDEYFTWTELKTVSSYILVSTGNPAPQPVLITSGQIDESWENCLVRVENSTCTKTPANLGNGEWEVNDGSGSIRVNDLAYSYIPTIADKYNITGNVSFSFDFYKIEPRFAADVTSAAVLFFTSAILPSPIEKNSITLNWTTNAESTTEVLYGTGTELEIDTLVNEELTTNHSIHIENLFPGSFYYIKVQSVSGPDTCRSTPILYSTASESSGKIRVCFNRAGIPPTEKDMEGIYTSSMIDTLVSYVNMAQTSLDIALYDFTNHASFSDERNAALVDAINAAFLRGVVVRFITDANVINEVIASLNPQIPILKVKTTAIMHDKFIVVDRETTMNSWIVSGSTNPTYNNLVIDFNNLVAIQDQSLAKAYNLEFNEMYGSSDVNPDTSKSEIGISKKDNTPHYFNVNGKSVELYFSPSDFTSNRIVNTLNKAEKSIDFAIMAFTDDLIGNALVNAKNSSKKVRGIIDYVEYSGSEYPKLLAAGVKVVDYANANGQGWPDAATLHHKFAVVDAGEVNGTVITGSHNWTAAADSKNDENTLIIHDSEISLKYKAEMQRIYQWLLPLKCNPDEAGALDVSSITVDVIANDILPDNFEMSIVKAPMSGFATINEDFSIRYESMLDCICDLRDTFVYQVCYPGDSDYCMQATVYINLMVSKNFICNNDTINSFDEYSLNFPVLENDFIPQTFNLSIVRQPENGVLYVLSDNTFYYEPNPFGNEKHISDTIVYKLCNQDGPLTCSEASVFISMDFSNGISESKTEKVKLYPNPVISDLEITANRVIAKIDIFDITGKIMQSLLPGKSSLSLKMPESKGLYYLRIQMDSGEIQMTKVVKL